MQMFIAYLSVRWYNRIAKKHATNSTWQIPSWKNPTNPPDFMKSILAPILLLAVFVSLAKADPSYVVTDLGAGNALALNNRGEVTAQLDSKGGVLYSHGHIVALKGEPYGINDLGEVTGILQESTPPFSFNGHAFVYRHGRTIDITPTAFVAAGFAINDANQVVGFFSPSLNSTSHPFFLQCGHLIDVGKLVGDGNLVSINNRGQAVGFYTTAPLNGNPASRAFLYTNGRVRDIAALGPNSAAARINDHGQIVGTSSLISNADIVHAFLTFGGSSIDLGTLPGTNMSTADGMNNSGVVIGLCLQIQGNVLGLVRPFIYSGGQLRDINTLIDPKSGWVLTNVASINDFDQIAGMGTLGTDTTIHALLLTPKRLNYCPRPGSDLQE
jgi:probable HAF family extracellular repeat protein